ncbi:hypothetical protein EV561_14312 [Rhizobium sp. BK376]|nr:hypothetical protein EV561_14312 [Rhizobium sp. BK376]
MPTSEAIASPPKSSPMLCGSIIGFHSSFAMLKICTRARPLRSRSRRSRNGRRSSASNLLVNSGSASAASFPTSGNSMRWRLHQGREILALARCRCQWLRPQCAAAKPKKQASSALVRSMFDSRHHIALRCPVRAHLVSDDALWRQALLLHQSDQQPPGRLRTAADLYDFVKHITILIDRSPKPVLAAADGNHHLIQVPNIPSRGQGFFLRNCFA